MTTAFSDWFEQIKLEAPLTEIGKLATAAGYHVAHTGGGCLCWEQTFDDGRYFWICDESNGLGESMTDTFLVGEYDSEGNDVEQDEVSGFKAALRWVFDRTFEMGGRA
jgi:uncharacterized membrane-anchored protein